jgi:hypothetical protein
MATKNREVAKREEFMLAGKLSELDWEPKSEEQISQALFRGTDPDKMVDAFEKQLGLDIKDNTPKNQVYKCVDLRPFNDEDRELLQKFYNNPAQYQLIKRTDNWTPKGDLIIFLEYIEDLDVKADKEQSE